MLRVSPGACLSLVGEALSDYVKPCVIQLII
jgi:hypothetical protein